MRRRTLAMLRGWNLVRYITLIVAIAGLCIAFLIVQRRVTEASLNLFAAQAVTVSVSKYMDEFKEWPKSSEDLKKVTFNGAYSLPEDSEEVMRRIEIHYNIGLTDVASADKDDFPFIKARGLIYVNSFKAKLQSVILMARKVLEEKQSRPQG